MPGVRGILRRRSSTLYQRGRSFRETKRLLLSGQLKESVELALRRGLYGRQLAEMEQFYFADGCRYADYYLRFENLQEDFDRLCRRLNIEQRTLPRAKTEVRRGDHGRHHHYQHYYTDFSRQRIADCCPRMLDEFGYSF